MACMILGIIFFGILLGSIAEALQVGAVLCLRMGMLQAMKFKALGLAPVKYHYECSLILWGMLSRHARSLKGRVYVPTL